MLVSINKRYSILFCILIYIFSIKGQGLVSIINQTVLVTPSNTLTNGTAISVSGKVKNASNSAITDFIHVNLAIDTSTTSVPKYYWRSTISSYQNNLLPDSLINFTVNDIADVTNKYKGGGGGTIIIIWATVGASTNTITTIDSAKTKVFLINVPTTGLNDLNDFEKYPISFNNPATDVLQLNYDETVYTKIHLTDISGKPIAEIWNKTLIVNELARGIYLLRFWDKKQNIYITKKIIIE